MSSRKPPTGKGDSGEGFEGHGLQLPDIDIASMDSCPEEDAKILS